MPTNALLDSLQAVRRKVKTLSVLFGVGVAIATAVGLLLGVLLVDYLFGLDKGPRLLLMLGALVLLVYIVYQRIIVPARSKLKVGDLAGRIEHTFPQFDDRLRSTVDFTQQDIPGSVAMKERVVREAGELAQSVRFERVILRKPVYLSLGGALLALVILGLLAVWGSHTGVLDIALNRLAMGNEAWPKTVEIAMVNKLPARIAAGQHIPVRIRLAKGDRDSRRATIYYRYDNGPWEQEIMSRQDGQYVATLDARLEQGKTNAKLDVRLEAGDDEKDLSPIAVVPRLELTHITADITPPEYVRQATPTRVNLIERPAIAAVGSEIAIAVQFNKALDPKKPVEILPVKEGATAPTVKWDRTSSDVAVAHFQAAQSLRFAVKATDEDGFQSAAGEEYELSVREDQPPTVQIEEPKRSEERTPNAAFDIKAVAEDDYGIVGAQLVVHRLNDQGKNSTDKNQWLIDLVENGQPVATDSALTWELVDNNPEHKRYRLVYNWQLEHLAGANLKPGDMLEYYLQVKDNFDLNGHQHDWVPSGRLRITIISADQFATIVQNQLEQIQQAINTTRLEQIRHKNETDTLRQGVDRNRRFDQADRAIASRLANDQSSTASQTMNIAQKLQDLRQTMNENKSPEGGPKQLAADVQQQLQQTADGPMRVASNDLNATKEQPLVDQPNQQKSDDQQPNDGQQKNNNPSTPSNNANNQSKNQNSQQNSRNSASANQRNSASNPQSDKNQQAGKQSDKNNPSDQKPQNSNQQANSQNKSTPAQARDAQQRSFAMANASQKQQQAADQLQQAMDKLGQMGGVSEAIQKLEKIRADQEKLENQFREANKNNIGKRNEDLSKEDQDKNKKMSDEQRKQAGDLQQTMNNMEKKAEQMAKSDPQASQAMKQASQMAQQQNLNSKQQQAADSMQQNQQAQAQQNQQQVELGLDVILARLKEAERRRLEELARQLESLQQLVSDLVMRQGGHNIDNLRLQGGDKRLAQLDPKERDELFDLADRDPQKMPPVPQLPSLTASQEQTERNARDIGKQAESLPDPTPSAKIIQAAESMERAIVHLRGNQLPDAYDPPQVEALHALADAQKQIDAALKQARQQLEKQDAESLKESYIKLLQKQKGVGQQIVQVDKTPKENGDLPRDVAIKLGQLPGDQGKLIDDAKGLGEKLKQLDSIVYNWANNDIIKSMGTVKDNLAKPQTGQPTQLAEQHVEEQLQDMIDSLVRKIDKKEFNSRENNGQQQNGKPGQNKPKLPSEAELRLLRKNQEAINKGTIDANKQAQKDKERVLDLGTRQGSMRDLLDQLIQRASEGKMKLGPEPDNRDQLPEEAKKQDVDDQELTQDLLGDNPSDDADANKIKLTGDRMARSRQRLALNDDPGAVTQEIQKRIVIDIDDLIKAAQAQQARMESRPGQQRQRQRMARAQQQNQQQQQQQQAQNQQHREDGNQAATVSRLDQGSDPKADLSQDLQQKLGEWGRITARDRQAVEQTAGEQEIGKYKNLIHDYYKSLAEQASKH